tara:strand:+ start:373 stop:579 length:207 start_codon:yes stop_codon:yes gene_type:complete
MQLIVEIMSSDSNKPSILETPTAIELKMIALWEIDLSPGILILPESGSCGLFLCLIFIPDFTKPISNV